MNYIKRPSLIFLGLLNRTWWLFPDKLFLQMKYRLEMGKRLDLNNPKTFSEKLQWLKLYNRKPEYTTMVDKYAVKEYVAGIIGEKYIIPTLGVWDKPEQIEWDKLPNQFVLKTTHGGGGGGVVICKDKTTFDKKKAIDKLNQSLKSDIYHTLREWPYKNVRKRIIAEKYMEDGKTKDLKDYKFFCFDGEEKYYKIDWGRFKEHHANYYDKNGNLMDCGESSFPRDLLSEVKQPMNLEEMKQLAEKLAAKLPFGRVDFYEVNGKTYFGEITFFPASGFEKFDPREWDEQLGVWINLPEPIGGGNLLIYSNVIIWVHANKNKEDDLKDYKFHCFDGEVKYFKIDYNRFVKHHANYYDKEGDRISLQELVNPSDDSFDIQIPSTLREMVSLANRLSYGFPFLRVDFYEINGKVYFGELTFFPYSGMTEYSPSCWDEKIGRWLNIQKT